MARDRANKTIADMKLGDTIEFPSFIGNLTKVPIVAKVVDITPIATILDATLYGVHVGRLEWRPGDKQPFFMEPPK